MTYEERIKAIEGMKDGIELEAESLIREIESHTKRLGEVAYTLRKASEKNLSVNKYVNERDDWWFRLFEDGGWCFYSEVCKGAGYDRYCLSSHGIVSKLDEMGLMFEEAKGRDLLAREQFKELLGNINKAEWLVYKDIDEQLGCYDRG